MPLATIVLAFGIMTIASALQAATGMGMALIAAPVLALLNTAYVPAPILVAVMALSALVAWRHRDDIDRAILPGALLGLLVGCPAGAALLVALGGIRPNRVFGLLILGAVGISLTGLRVPVNRVALFAGAAASGILGTMSGAHGPPIALVLQHQAPAKLRATLCGFFAVACAVSLSMLYFGGLLRWPDVLRGIALLPGVAVGWLTAPLLNRWIDRRRARWAVLAMSAASALVLLVRT